MTSNQGEPHHEPDFFTCAGEHDTGVAGSHFYGAGHRPDAASSPTAIAARENPDRV
ncbi:hypothetical protein [Xenorhabdus anantnagensis]|uniref:Uncharacterized protein n=1 Tax=Xenorhabdus anantnagensis TaxID=3025875 RepID=A0ABT5LU41_9GAMM|nr:hypothetical protein [Xenorhabdus anantnagensis]MDC9597930.1 hypothetical protein [Xenorhabdus anantnagensis]